MAIQSKIVARKEPGKQTPSVKYYLSPFIVKVASQRDVAKLMSHGMTITEQEADLAIQQMTYAVLTLLQQGHSVKINNLGTFSLSFNCMGADNAESVTVNNIKRINCNLRINPDFREQVQKTEVVIVKGNE